MDHLNVDQMTKRQAKQVQGIKAKVSIQNMDAKLSLRDFIFFLRTPSEGQNVQTTIGQYERG